MRTWALGGTVFLSPSNRARGPLDPDRRGTFDLCYSCCPSPNSPGSSFNKSRKCLEMIDGLEIARCTCVGRGRSFCVLPLATPCAALAGHIFATHASRPGTRPLPSRAPGLYQWIVHLKRLTWLHRQARDCAALPPRARQKLRAVPLCYCRLEAPPRWYLGWSSLTCMWREQPEVYMPRSRELGT